MNRLLLFLGVFLPVLLNGQTHHEISFSEATHHIAEISAQYKGLTGDVAEIRMSRTSPGRYAIHDFAKNVFAVKAFNSKGIELEINRPNPQQWNVKGHDGVVTFKYKLFADRADGTYSQIDESHAHLNIPATFAYAKGLEEKPITVNFNTTAYPQWKVATQLKKQVEGTYFAPHLQYFMDSPTELSDFVLREFTETSNGKSYNIRLALHHNGDDEEIIDNYFEWVKKIVRQEKLVYGELPDFDYGTYTFLACYRDNASGDGMEHRNSTILTSSRGLSTGGGMGQIGTVSHEFFHAWNVERIRPASLEPFSFEDANMSGELWFAEGFTSYYTNLILCRAGIITPKQYIEGLSGNLNYVWNSPARQFFNPIEMSYQAPFVDAATSVDPTNRGNTFISYYSYGSAIGLALDLSLRNTEKDLNLDDFMKQVWNKYGKNEIPYKVSDLQRELVTYAGKKFANQFFESYIYNTEKPDYKKLFESVGVNYSLANLDKVTLGMSLQKGRDSIGLVVTRYPDINSPAYKASITKKDIILEINENSVNSVDEVTKYLENITEATMLSITYERFGKKKTTTLTPVADYGMKTVLFEDNKMEVSDRVLKNRSNWLNGK